MFRWLLKIGSRLIAIVLMCGITAGIIYLASSRSLPLLPEEDADYSVIPVEESSADVSRSDKSAEEASSDVSSEVSEESGEESGEADYLSSFKTVVSGSPTDVSGHKYDTGTQEIVINDVPSDIKSLGPDDVSVRMGFTFLSDGRVFDPRFRDITELVSGLTFTGLRDSEMMPIFKNEETGEMFFVNENDELIPTDFDEHLDKLGFDFDVPVYLCEQTDDAKRVYSKSANKYGYRAFAGTNDERVYCYYDYEEVFAFYPFLDNGEAKGTGATLITRQGVQYLEFYGTKFNRITIGPREGQVDNTVAVGFYPPDDRSLDSIGYFYFCDGYTRVKNLREDGAFEERLMDPLGKLLKRMPDFEIKAYSDGIMLLEKKGIFGYATTSLNWITDPMYEEALPFLEGLAVVKTNGRYGVITTTGDYAIEPVFDKILNCSGGVIAAYDEEHGWTFFNKLYIHEEKPETSDETSEEDISGDVSEEVSDVSEASEEADEN